MNIFFSKYRDDQAPNVRESFLLMFMAFVTFGLYLPALQGPFSILDDKLMVLDVLNNQSWSYVKASYDITKGGIYSRPLPTTVFVIISMIFGLSPAPLHLLNVLMHLGSGLLIYFSVRRLYGNGGLGMSGAFTAAMIFLIHPLNVEAVAWISGRATVMATFFVLLAFFYHHRAQRNLKDWRLWAAALCYMLSLFSYELAVAMPLVFVYWDLDQHKLDSWQQTIKMCSRRWVPYGLVLAVYIVFRLLKGFGKNVPGVSGSKGDLIFLSLFDSFLSHFSSPFVALGFYLKKVFWPWPLNFHIAHISPVLRPLYLVLGVIFLLALAWWLWKQKWIGFWALWFFCGLFAVLPLSFHSFSWTSTAERYVYLSSIAFAGSSSLLVFRVLSSKPRWVAQTSQILVVVLLFVFGIGTALRAKTWQSDLTLLQDAWRKSPDSGRVADAYARTLMAAGREGEAITHWKKAIDLGRVSQPAYFLGKVEQGKKNYAAAEKYYLQSLWPTRKFAKKGTIPVTDIKFLHKRAPKVYLTLADLHWKMAEEEKGHTGYHYERIIHFHQTACELKPDDAYLKYLLAKAYLRGGDLEQAKVHFAQVSDMAPDTYYGKAAAKLAKAESIRKGQKIVGSREQTRQVEKD